MNDKVSLKATAKVTLTKLDGDGNVIGVDVQEIELSSEEANAIWQSQQVL